MSVRSAGEAVYCDDIPRYHNELYLGLVLSQRAHARIVSVDPSAALAMEGVHLFLSAKDLPDGKNEWGAIFHDDEVFASAEVRRPGPSLRTTRDLIGLDRAGLNTNLFCVQVQHFGQIIAAVAADDQLIAQRAAKAVKVQYEDLPAIITIEASHITSIELLSCLNVGLDFKEEC